ncbi:response regulator [Actibacterium sp. 188UL27-1]|uniref:response regulator n=1 Tax=Actibacterium sp. 188UL27-1 TaxID=2786961 RepID=UPI0019586405|nr:response regulator [Actibacterium sp. 188UL27-1]MBM7068447.1 response regulator [Actibacterium sp. 188UL27-1]
MPVRALIVEDDPNLRLLWDSVLTDDGFRTVCVNSVLAAEQAMASRIFEVIVMDMKLEDGDAMELTRSVGERQPEAKVLIVTGSSLYPKRELQEISSNVFAVLRKPVDVELLSSTCKRMIQQDQGAS